MLRTLRYLRPGPTYLPIYLSIKSSFEHTHKHNVEFGYEFRPENSLSLVVLESIDASSFLLLLPAYHLVDQKDSVSLFNCKWDIATTGIFKVLYILMVICIS